MLKFLIQIPFFLFAVSSAFAGASPSVAKLTIYGVAVSQNYDCSNAIVVGYNSGGTVYDFLQNPALVSGNIPAGTYQCVVLYTSDVLTFTPASSNVNGANAPGCVAGTSYSRTICNQQNGCTFTTSTVDANNNLIYVGTATAASTSSSDIADADKVLLFLSTGSSGNGTTPFLQPTGATASVKSTNGLPLGAPLVVSSSGGAGTFVVNFGGQVSGQGNGGCDLGPPAFSFR